MHCSSLRMPVPAPLCGACKSHFLLRHSAAALLGAGLADDQRCVQRRRLPRRRHGRHWCLQTHTPFGADLLHSSSGVHAVARLCWAPRGDGPDELVVSWGRAAGSAGSAAAGVPAETRPALPRSARTARALPAACISCAFTRMGLAGWRVAGRVGRPAVERDPSWPRLTRLAQPS